MKLSRASNGCEQMQVGANLPRAGGEASGTRSSLCANFLRVFGTSDNRNPFQEHRHFCLCVATRASSVPQVFPLCRRDETCALSESFAKPEDAKFSRTGRNACAPEERRGGHCFPIARNRPGLPRCLTHAGRRRRWPQKSTKTQRQEDGTTVLNFGESLSEVVRGEQICLCSLCSFAAMFDGTTWKRRLRLTFEALP